MESRKIPNILFYTTVVMPDGSVESPHYLVFDSAEEGIQTVKEHYKNLFKEPARIIMKEMMFIDTCLLPEEAYILMPSNDMGLEEDFADQEHRQRMVNDAEDDGPEDAIALVFPDQQDIETARYEAYYMGPMHKARTIKEFIRTLEENPFEISQPPDTVWLYRPTGEEKILDASH